MKLDDWVGFRRENVREARRLATDHGEPFSGDRAASTPVGAAFVFGDTLSASRLGARRLRRKA